MVCRLYVIFLRFGLWRPPVRTVAAMGHPATSRLSRSSSSSSAPPITLPSRSIATPLWSGRCHIPLRLQSPTSRHATPRRAFIRSSGAGLSLLSSALEHPAASPAHSRSSRRSSAPSTMSPPRLSITSLLIGSPSPPLRVAIALLHVAPSVHAKQWGRAWLSAVRARRAHLDALPRCLRLWSP